MLSPPPIILIQSVQQVTLSYNKCLITLIYAKTDYVRRKLLWKELSQIPNFTSSHWLLMGDLNAVLGAHERQGCKTPLGASCTDLQSFINDCNLIDICPKGHYYTWNSGSQFSRLDRALTNSHWLSFWQEFTCTVLTKCSSDHHSLLVHSLMDCHMAPKPFKFLNAWFCHPSFMDVVKSTWSTPTVGHPIFILQSKLKLLKLALKTWNKDVFGNIHQKVIDVDAINILDSIQKRMVVSMSDQLLREEIDAKAIYLPCLSDEERLWKDKAKSHWLIDGDRNTTFFHKIASHNSHSNKLTTLSHDGISYSSPSDIQLHVVQFFTNL